MVKDYELANITSSQESLLARSAFVNEPDSQTQPDNADYWDPIVQSQEILMVSPPDSSGLDDIFQTPPEAADPGTDTTDSGLLPDIDTTVVGVRVSEEKGSGSDSGSGQRRMLPTSVVADGSIYVKVKKYSPAEEIPLADILKFLIRKEEKDDNVEDRRFSDLLRSKGMDL